jgi:hypothetical protein
VLGGTRIVLGNGPRSVGCVHMFWDLYSRQLVTAADSVGKQSCYVGLNLGYDDRHVMMIDDVMLPNCPAECGLCGHPMLRPTPTQPCTHVACVVGCPRAFNH